MGFECIAPAKSLLPNYVNYVNRMVMRPKLRLESHGLQNEDRKAFLHARHNSYCLVREGRGACRGNDFRLSVFIRRPTNLQQKGRLNFCSWIIEIDWCISKQRKRAHFLAVNSKGEVQRYRGSIMVRQNDERRRKVQCLDFGPEQDSNLFASRRFLILF